MRDLDDRGELFEVLGVVLDARALHQRDRFGAQTDEQVLPRLLTAGSGSEIAGDALR